MKHRRLIFSCLITFFMMFGVFSVALAQTLSLQATSDGTNEETDFEQGDALYLNIVVVNAAGVAGCAFTLIYPPGVLTAPATSAEGTPVNADEITSIFPFTFVNPTTPQESTDTHRVNSSEAGKIYFSGAAIDTSDGGAKYNSGEAVLFTVKFTVKSNAPLGNFGISLTQTELFNIDAGYGTDNNSNGTYDEGVDQKGKVPVLVGAVAQGEPGFDNFDCSNPPCAFPILLGDDQNPFVVVTLDNLQVPPSIVGYENWKTTNGWTEIGDMDVDYDLDGYSNVQEFINGTDPTAQNEAGGVGYNTATDNRLPHFPTPTGTTDWEDYYGNLTVANLSAEVGDEVGVYAGNLLVGKYEVLTEGQYGFLHVYGESSPGAGDGAASGASLTFKVWDKSTMTEYSCMTTVKDQSADPPQYLGGKVTKNVDLETVMAQKIPLTAGWNLISFSVNTCFYDSDTEPNATMISGVEDQKVASIGEVFSSIVGKYTTVSSFDADYAHTYDPDPAMADFNDLHYIAPGYGYWIKMTEAAILTINGARVSSSATIDLNTNWNLVGYWLDKCKYDCDTAPNVALPEGAGFEKVGSIGEVLNSITGKYTTVSSFDADYAHTYDPDPAMADFNDLHYMAPGYGYWIKMTEPGTLGY